MPEVARDRSGETPDYKPPPQTPDQTSWERWYENVREDQTAPTAVTTASAPPGQAHDPYADGPTGSGLV